MNKVLFLRRGLGIQQEYLANKLGISRSTLKKKESGKSDFTKSEMLLITEEFKTKMPTLTIDQIFFDSIIAIWE